MSDLCYCDNCRKVSWRKLGEIAPKDWWYLEAKNEDDPSDAMYVYACSELCTKKIWKPGPGELT